MFILIKVVLRVFERFENNLLYLCWLYYSLKQVSTKIYFKFAEKNYEKIIVPWRGLYSAVDVFQLEWMNENELYPVQYVHGQSEMIRGNKKFFANFKLR